MKIIDGKLISSQICDSLLKEIKELKKCNIVPSLKLIQVGDDQASNTYIRNKIRLSEKMGVNTTLSKFDLNVSSQELMNHIEKLNNDSSIHGILVQLPLPKQINEKLIIEQINPLKDVDCFNLKNVGKLWTTKKNEFSLLPCTPAGIIELLKRSNIQISSKHVVIIGRSNIVGKPLAALMLLEDATVTICHSKTKNLQEICKQADILVSAIGIAKKINRNFIKPNAVIIDVGINRDENNVLCGDIDFEDVKNLVSFITPVPGGVGPMTITILLKNLISVCKIQNNIK